MKKQNLSSMYGEMRNSEFWFNKLLEIFKDTARFGCIRINNVSIRFSWYSFSQDKTTLFLSDENGKGIAIVHLENIVSVE